MEKGHKRSLDDLLNQNCPTQFLTDVGSSANKWVQNNCVQNPWVQLFTDASKRGNDTSYAPVYRVVRKNIDMVMKGAIFSFGII